MPESIPRTEQPERRRLHVSGRVQGVGFRPFVYRLAVDLHLVGCVGNDTRGAFIEIEGPAGQLDRFADRLHAELPAVARISAVVCELLPLQHDTAFVIRHSDATGEQNAEITPDVATCPDCLAELFDPHDRRHRYPFINCTNCGPRYSIVTGVPYDRIHTTMSAFNMCPACQAEYDDPGHRRFHAQPNACPACGPRAWYTDAAGREQPGDAIRLTADALRAGLIVAIKGLGGFHLACRADDDAAVRRLRERKQRESKPLAVMVADLDAARRLALVSDAAATCLAGPDRPIVLLPPRPGSRLGPQVSPDCSSIGLMLPYTPIHHLLFAEHPGPLVMTSGNPSAEPLCCDNAEALARLGAIADGLLLHDRPIARRVDDSVVLDVEPADIVPIRRARGLAPAPIRLARPSPMPVLAVGGELKSAICLLAGTQAVLSEHLGELDNAVAFRNFAETIEKFQELLRVRPARVACDLHPDYAATRHAATLGLPIVGVQHHHAHLASLLAEHGREEPIVAIVCDGTGYGTDGAIWGGEVLVGNADGFERAAHLAYFPLPGGDAGARQTWRPALGLVSQLRSTHPELAARADFSRVDPAALQIARQRLQHSERLPRTSSLGRLFDAVAYLLGVCDENRHEAEAAMRLEALAAAAPPVGRCGTGVSPVQSISDPTSLSPILLDPGLVIGPLIADHGAGRPLAECARAFHETLAVLLSDAAFNAAAKGGIDIIGLTGGCFANRLLTRLIAERVREAGLNVLTHHLLPPGDGGLAVGQAVIAARRDA